MSYPSNDIEQVARGLAHIWADLPLVDVIQKAIRLGAEMSAPKQAGLTEKQAELLNFIRKHIADHGYAPTYNQMLTAMGLASKSGIHRLVSGLEERGYIRRTPHRRQAIVLYGDGAPPQVVRPVVPRGSSHKADTVRQAALEGYGQRTAAAIASEYGVSRNAVIGHWFRLRKAGLIKEAEAA